MSRRASREPSRDAAVMSFFLFIIEKDKIERTDGRMIRNTYSFDGDPETKKMRYRLYRSAILRDVAAARFFFLFFPFCSYLYVLKIPREPSLCEMAKLRGLTNISLI